MYYCRFVLIFAALIHGVAMGQTLLPDEDEEAETVVTMSVDAVLGGSAVLPCDVEPSRKQDRVYIVLWYKELNKGGHKPIYSFDVRGRPFTKALHWSDPETFGPRAYFVTVSKPAALTLDGIQLEDEGIYSCRVDFRTSPTRNFAINLTVIVPPHQLLLYDNSGRDVTGVVGPLVEGSDLVLTCEVRGGRPTPTVSWFVNERMVEGQISDVVNNRVRVNKLEVLSVTRDQLNSTYKCQASNTKLRMPAERAVRLELFLRPLSAVITEKPQQLVANEEVTLKCEVMGSRPHAVISWIMDNREFRRGKIRVDRNETMVISSLTFAPVPEDDNTMLQCKGDNPKLEGVSQTDTFSLNVVYPPQVNLHLGSTLNPEDIKEGDDVYFECIIKANPRQHRITWFHDGMLVTQNMSSGVIISTHSLVLQRVTRSQSGSYTCRATNPRGETASAPVILGVKYAPICASESDITIIGASIEEELKVRCQISADPSDVTFSWQFNNSGESFDVSPTRFVTASGNISELEYVPKSQRDYGTLTCWAKNSIGRQIEPCIFQVVPAAKPNPLTNCTLRTAHNQSAEVVEVECRAGYDGGLPQRFILEAYDAFTMRPMKNLTVKDTEFPVFRLDLNELLPSPSALRMVVYAENAKGRSEKLVLDDITLNDAEKRTDGNSHISLVPLAGLLTGSLLTIGLAVLVIVVIAVRRRRHCDGRPHCSHHLGIDASKHQPKSRQGSMLEINTGDNRYVVAYTVKPAADCAPMLPPPPTLTPPDHRRQPDILNTPRGADTTPTGLPRPDALFSTTNPEQQPVTRHQLNCTSPPLFANNAQSPANNEMTSNLGRSRPRPRDNSYTSFATMRRDHIIADSIPGPESCV